MPDVNQVHVTDLTPARQWWEERGQKCFARFTALEFFIKKHRVRLVAERALIPGKGARPTMISGRMDTLIPELWIEEADADPKNQVKASDAA